MTRILVVGGSGGIGSAIAATLIAAGYEVDLTFNRTPPNAHGYANSYRCDLSSAHERKSTLEAMKTDGRSYYGMIHAAGVTYDSPALTLDIRQAQELMEVNFWSFVDFSKGVLPDMMRAKGGRIIAIGSIASQKGQRGNGAYSASKAAVSAFVRTLALECSSRGVSINDVQPGFIETSMIAPYERRREEMLRTIPAGRFGAAHEVAGLVRYLLSPEAAFVTGSSVVIDGATTA